jgi:putative ABC transport system substrate-binding protein
MRSLLTALFVLLSSVLPVSAEPRLIAITSVFDHPALDAVRDGLKDGLKQESFVEGDDVLYVFRSMRGARSNAMQIAQPFAGERPAVVVAISTRSAQAMAAGSRDLPIAFSAVTDPLGMRPVETLEYPGTNVTGVSDLAPVTDQLALIREIAPTIRRLGVVFNPAEASSVSLVRLLRDRAATYQISVFEAPVTKSADAHASVRSLVGQVDAIYVPTDSTVVSDFDAVIGVAEAAKLPVFSGDTETVYRGALASVGFDYRRLGLETARIVARVLRGEKPSQIPVAFASGSEIILNQRAAERIGLILPASVIARASTVLP